MQKVSIESLIVGKSNWQFGTIRVLACDGIGDSGNQIVHIASSQNVLVRVVSTEDSLSDFVIVLGGADIGGEIKVGL